MGKISEYQGVFWIMSLYLYALGFLSNLSYYSVFGIEIETYFSLSDSFISTFSLIAVVAALIIPIEVVVYVLYHFVEHKGKRKEVNNNRYLYVTPIYLLVILILLAFFDYAFSSSLLIIIIAIVVISIVIRLVIYIGKVEHKHKKSYGMMGQKSLLYIVLISFTAFVCTHRYVSAKQVMNGKTDYKFSLEAANNSFSSKQSPQIRYVGQSGREIFLYDIELDETIVVNKEFVYTFNIEKPSIGRLFFFF